MSFRESFARVNSKDPTVTALTSLTVTATEGYTTMRDLTTDATIWFTSIRSWICRRR